MIRELQLALCGLFVAATPAASIARSSAIPAAIASAEKQATPPAVRGDVVTPAPAPAKTAPRSESFRQQHAQAGAALVQRLTALAGWCNLKSLFEERDRVYRQILLLDPDNTGAHQGLKHVRNQDGTYKESSAKPPTNLKKDALPQFVKKRSEAVAPYRDALLALLDAESAEPPLRAEIYTEILAFDPDDERVRGILGDARLGDAWVMAETASGKQRRSEIKAAAEKWKSEPATTEEIEPTEAEQKLADAWTASVRTPSIRVLGLVEKSEVETIAQACEGARDLVAAVFKTEVKLPKDLTFYVMDPEQRDAFVDKLPGASDEQREALKKTVGAGVPGSSNVFVADEDPAKRLDCAVRHTLIHALRETFGVGVKQGWVWEGLGLYLTRELVGTRLTWFVLASPGVEQDSLSGNLLTPESNWMAEALGLLNGEHPPDLVEVVGRDLPSLALEDMLIGYALSAYLVEGRPAEAPELLARLGKGVSPAQAFEKSLHVPLADLQPRVKRWLEERK
jgi:hypothetical protein